MSRINHVNIGEQLFYAENDLLRAVALIEEKQKDDMQKFITQ